MAPIKYVREWPPQNPVLIIIEAPTPKRAFKVLHGRASFPSQPMLGIFATTAAAIGHVQGFWIQTLNPKPYTLNPKP